jgi:opacity protein-like surface antigen
LQGGVLVVGRDAGVAVFHALNLRQAFETCKPLISLPPCFVSKLTHFETKRDQVSRSVCGSLLASAMWRAALLILNSSLLFLTSGLAVADVQDDWVPVGSGTSSGFSKSGINFGAALGAGGEFAVAERVSVSLQYLYLAMLERSATLSCLGCSTPTYNYLLDDSASIFRVGVNYHFN